MRRICWRSFVVALVSLPVAACNSASDATNQADRQQDRVVAGDERPPTHGETLPAAAPSSFIPTAVGTRWKWQSKTTVGDDKGPLRPTVFTSEQETRIVGHEDIQGKKCLRMEVTDDLGTVVQTEVISLEPEGVFRHRMNEDSFEPPIKVLALPATVGVTWKGHYTTQGIEVENTSTIAAQETVTVPAGTFDALRVEVEHPLVTTTTWYVPQIGVVKQVVDKPLLIQKDELELIEFDVSDSGR